MCLKSALIWNSSSGLKSALNFITCPLQHCFSYLMGSGGRSSVSVSIACGCAVTFQPIERIRREVGEVPGAVAILYQVCLGMERVDSDWHGACHPLVMEWEVHHCLVRGCGGWYPGKGCLLSPMPCNPHTASGRSTLSLSLVCRWGNWNNKEVNYFALGDLDSKWRGWEKNLEHLDRDAALTLCSPMGCA